MNHSLRVTDLAVRIARALRAERRVEEAILVGGPLHDLGKFAVSDEILAKPGPLDGRELAEVRQHPVIGVRMLAGVRSVRAGLGCVLHHHERWDGGGYPNGLQGAEIPLEARIVAVADAFDAMTSERPYRAPLTPDAALEEVDRCAGTQFDPQVADAFVQLGLDSLAE